MFNLLTDQFAICKIVLYLFSLTRWQWRHEREERTYYDDIGLENPSSVKSLQNCSSVKHDYEPTRSGSEDIEALDEFHFATQPRPGPIEQDGSRDFDDTTIARVRPASSVLPALTSRRAWERGSVAHVESVSQRSALRRRRRPTLRDLHFVVIFVIPTARCVLVGRGTRLTRAFFRNH